MKEINKKIKILISTILIFIIVFFAFTIKYILDNRYWKQDGNLIYKGNKKYNIGDYYEYDETANGRINVSDVKWKVLGIDENGHLLIVSASSVENLTLGNEQSLELAKNDYIDGKDKMNKIASKYGEVGALYARSITNEDIFKVLGKEPIKEEIENTFYWSTSENPIGDLGEVKLTYKDSIFYYFDSTNKWTESRKVINPTENVKIGSFKNNLVTFENKILYGEDIITNIDEKSKVFKMLFLEDNNEKSLYWTTNSYTNVSASYISYGYNAVKYDSLNYNNLIYSSGNTRQSTCGIRVVVGIK